MHCCRTAPGVKPYIPKMEEPELMYKLFDKVAGTLDKVIKAL